MVQDIVLALPRLVLESEHTKNSYIPGMPLGSWVERNRVAVLARLGIQVGLGAFPIEKERVMSRQPPRPQALVEVDRVLSIVICSFCLQKETEVQIRIHIIHNNL